MPRIAIAGFQHETNTFAATRAGWSDFVMADSWPGLLTGPQVIEEPRATNLPIAGFVEAAAAEPRVELVPLLWCAAEPAAEVTDDAFERVWHMLHEGLRAAWPIDGLYLDLHGAMVTESHEDGEGEILGRLRATFGPDLPIVASLDFHANVTPVMVRHADRLALYRSYPHLDMAATGARCLPHLLARIGGRRWAKAFRQAPYLVPLHAQFTGAEPCASLFEGLEEIGAELAMGFTGSDIHDAGPSLTVYARDANSAEARAEALLARMLDAESRFDADLLSPAQAVAAAMATPGPGPAVLAEVQDNPGGGAGADSTDLLSELAKQGATGAVLGLLNDPEIAAVAHAAGEGAVIASQLGGKCGLPGLRPFEGRFAVERLTDGQCRYTGQMYRGGIAAFGPSALLRLEHADIWVAVTSIRNQALDLGQFTHFGIDPRAARILCVKSTAHFRADFEPIAATILNVRTPGALSCVLSEVPYRRLRPGVRLGPGGPVHRPARPPRTSALDIPV
jgi:microcystin degradation protein MlrC